MGTDVGTSDDIIGKHKLNEVKPSIEVAAKFADPLRPIRTKQTSRSYRTCIPISSTIKKQTKKLLQQLLLPMYRHLHM